MKMTNFPMAYQEEVNPVKKKIKNENGTKN